MRNIEILFIENDHNGFISTWSETMPEDTDPNDAVAYAKEFVLWCERMKIVVSVLVVWHDGNMPEEWEPQDTVVMEVTP